MSKFRDDLNKAYDKKVVKNVELAVRRVAVALDRILVQRTPVDTGRARSNWLPSLNTPASGQVEPNAKPELLSAISGYNHKDVVFISNNLPYIRKLNDGHSRQAPAGFVDDAVMKATRAAKIGKRL